VVDARTMSLLLQRRNERQIAAVAPWTPPITVRAFAREHDHNMMRMLDRFCLRPAVGVVYTSYQPPAMGPGEPSVRDDPYVKELKRHAAMSMLPVGLPPDLNSLGGSSNQSSFAAPRPLLRVPTRFYQQRFTQRGEPDSPLPSPTNSLPTYSGASLRRPPALSLPVSPIVKDSETGYDRNRRDAWIKHFVSKGQFERARGLGWSEDDDSGNGTHQALLFGPLLERSREDAPAVEPQCGELGRCQEGHGIAPSAAPSAEPLAGPSAMPSPASSAARPFMRPCRDECTSGDARAAPPSVQLARAISGTLSLGTRPSSWSPGILRTARRRTIRGRTVVQAVPATACCPATQSFSFDSASSDVSMQSVSRHSYQIEDMEGLDELSEPHEFSPSIKRNSSVL